MIFPYIQAYDTVYFTVTNTKIEQVLTVSYGNVLSVPVHPLVCNHPWLAANV